MGFWSLFTAWRSKQVGCISEAQCTFPRAARRRNQRTTRQFVRHCAFEAMEPRRLLDADPIRIGVTYLEEDSGSDLAGDTFQVLFEGGAPATELTRLVIDGDHGPPGLSVGDMIFDTVKGGLGADEAFLLQVVSSTGIDDVSWQVIDGSSQLVFEFSGFHVGDKLVFSIDVDEIQQFDPGVTAQQVINEGIDPIASGVEFQGSLLTGDFQAPHYHDVSGTSEFRNLYDPLFGGTTLLISQGNPNGLPHDDFQGKRDRSTGTLLPLQQAPLPVTIAGRVFADNNRNLVQDSADFGLSNVSLALWQEVDGLWTFTEHTTTTNVQGDYLFGLDLDLRPGLYEVRETQPADYLSVGAIPGNVSGVPSGQAVSGDPDILTEIDIPFGDLHAVRYDFAEFQPASLRGRVHLTEPSGDCETEGSETRPLANVQITLKDSDGNIIDTRLTDANGEYVFDNLTPGTYTIVEVTPPGLIDGEEHIGTISNVPVGVIGGDDLVTNITLLGGEDGIHYDFCEHEPASISGFVYHDANNNGVRDAGEAAIPAATVLLLDASGAQLASRSTDDRGAYQFDGLSAGDYIVRELQPAGWLDGLDAAGTIGGAVVGAAENPGDLIGGITLLWGDQGVEYNFGEILLGKISGYVFRDGPPIMTTNGEVPANINQIRDGQLTPDDLRLGGVVLELRHTLSGDPVLGEELPGAYPPGPVRTVTDANGYYEFTGLPQGNYSIFEVHPQGFIDSIDTPGSTSGLAVNAGAAVSPLLIQRFAAAGVSFNNDAILQVPLGSGQHSQFNNFSEIQVEQIIIPPPESRRPTPPPPRQIPPPLFPPIILPPQVFIPPPVPQLITGGGAGFTWHLSIIDAGLPRVARRGTTLNGLIFRPALWIEKTEWQPENLKSGSWHIHGVDGAAPQALFGLPGATPVVGDYNGDGRADIGVYLKGEWFLDLNGNGQWDPEDLWAKLGSEADRPVTGDWDGDGKDDIAIFGPEWPGDPVHLENEAGLPDQDNRLLVKRKPKNVPLNPEEATDGQRLMRLTAQGKERADLIDHVFQFGSGGDIPIAGDWNGDGIRSVGVFREGKWHFDMDGDGRWSAGDKTAHFGAKGDLPVVGDFDGDGIEEIAIFRSGKWVIDSNGNRQLDAADREIEFGQPGDLPIAGDFNGDGADEPALYRPSPEVNGP